jgi:hypothetical protein
MRLDMVQPRKDVHTIGLANAELQHLRSFERKGSEGQKTNLLDPYLVATIDIGNSPITNPLYTPEKIKENAIQAMNSGMMAGETGIEAAAPTKKSNDLLLVGQGAKVSIMGNISEDHGSDILIIGNGAKVDIKTSIGIDNSNDTIFVGNGAKLSMNMEVGETRGSSTLILENGAELSVIGKLSLSESDGGISIIKGKVMLEFKDEANQTFQLGLKVKNKEQAEHLIGKVKDELGKGSFSLDEIKNKLHEINKEQENPLFQDRAAEWHKHKKGIALGINKHMIPLELMSNLIRSFAEAQQAPLK